jgi:hypothetical protein
MSAMVVSVENDEAMKNLGAEARMRQTPEAELWDPRAWLAAVRHTTIRHVLCTLEFLFLCLQSSF